MIRSKSELAEDSSLLDEPDLDIDDGFEYVELEDELKVSAVE